MCQDRHVGTVHCAQHTFGHCRAVHLEARVDRRDHVIKSGQQLLVVIQTAVGENVRLHALEHTKVRGLGIERIDLVVLFEHCFSQHAGRVEGRLRMVRNAEIAPTLCARRLRHLGDRRLAVRVLRVTVQYTADVL